MTEFGAILYHLQKILIIYDLFIISKNSEFYMNSIYSTNKQILRIRLKILYNLTNRDLFLLCKYIDLPFVVYVFFGSWTFESNISFYLYSSNPWPKQTNINMSIFFCKIWDFLKVLLLQYLGHFEKFKMKYKGRGNNSWFLYIIRVS